MDDGVSVWIRRDNAAVTPERIAGVTRVYLAKLLPNANTVDAASKVVPPFSRVARPAPVTRPQVVAAFLDKRRAGNPCFASDNTFVPK